MKGIKVGILRDLLDFIFPPQCHVCSTPLCNNERFVCAACLSKLPRTLYHRRSPNPMELRFAGLFPFRRATGVFFYSRNSPLASLIQDFKYRKFPSLAVRLGEVAAEDLVTTGFFNGIDMIIPVPMHFIKQASRGYNQAERIAAGISRVTDIPVKEALTASRPHKTQTSMSLSERMTNTKGIFRTRHPELLHSKSVLLVDDVCTTGSTLIQAATTLTADIKNVEISLLSLGVTF